MIKCIFRRRKRSWSRWKWQNIGDGCQWKAVLERHDQWQYNVDDHHSQLQRVVDNTSDPQPVAVQSEEATVGQRKRDRRRRWRFWYPESWFQRHVAHSIPEREREKSSHTDPEYGCVKLGESDEHRLDEIVLYID